MLAKLINISIFIFLVSCKQGVRINEHSSESVVDHKSEELTRSEQSILNDTLVKQLENGFDEIKRDPKFSIEKKLVNNKHVDNQIDTIKVYKFDKTTIQSYKTPDEEWIMEAQIQNSGFKFGEFMHVGMGKNELEQVLIKKLNSDVVKISNFEETSTFILKFDKDYLIEIVYQGYLD